MEFFSFSVLWRDIIFRFTNESNLLLFALFKNREMNEWNILLFARFKNKEMSEDNITSQAVSASFVATALNNNDDDDDNFFEDTDAPPPRTSPFQVYWEDQEKVKPKNKIKLLLCVAASGAVDGLSLKDLAEEPFKGQIGITPGRAVLRDELRRRDPAIKTLVRHSVDQLMELMKSSNNLLTAECLKFVYEKFVEVKIQFSKTNE